MCSQKRKYFSSVILLGGGGGLLGWFYSVFWENSIEQKITKSWMAGIKTNATQKGLDSVYTSVSPFAILQRPVSVQFGLTLQTEPIIANGFH